MRCVRCGRVNSFTKFDKRRRARCSKEKIQRVQQMVKKQGKIYSPSWQHGQWSYQSQPRRWYYRNEVMPRRCLLAIRHLQLPMQPNTRTADSNSSRWTPALAIYNSQRRRSLICNRTDAVALRYELQTDNRHSCGTVGLTRTNHCKRTSTSTPKNTSYLVYSQ